MAHVPDPIDHYIHSIPQPRATTDLVLPVDAVHLLPLHPLVPGPRQQFQRPRRGCWGF